MPLLPSQLDGNYSCDSITDSDDHETLENNDNPDTPPLHSTPDHCNIAHISSPLHDESPRDIPGLLDSLDHDQSLSSVSLESHPDLDNFLPFAVPIDPNPTSPHRSSALSSSAGASPDNFSPFDEPSLSLGDLPDLESFLPVTTSPDHSNQPSNHSPLPENDPQTMAYPIPVIVGNTPNPSYQSPSPTMRPPCRTTVKRNNKAIVALTLPNIMVTNHRSLFPKFNNLIDELIENEMHLGLHSEIWEDGSNVAHKNKVEEALEIQGIKYISTPRRGRRGGGAAITLIADSPFTLTQLHPSPLNGTDSLEVCWGLLRPNTPSGHIRNIIVCSFYSPPNSRKKKALIQHLTLNYYKYKSMYPDSAFVCGGDKNDLNIHLLLDIHPTFKQLVTQPTYRLSVLDVIVTDIGHYYQIPTIRPPVLPDNPANGSPSDHRIAFVRTISTSTPTVNRVTFSRSVRPLPDTAVLKFANWVQHEPWTFVYNGVDSSDMADRFTFLVQLNLNTHQVHQFRWQDQVSCSKTSLQKKEP